MANKFRGEATLKRDGGDDILLVFDAGAFCHIEEVLEKRTGERAGLQDVVNLFTSEEKVGMRDMRLLLQATTRRTCPMTDEQAEDAISDCGMEETMSALMQAMERAMPEVAKGNPRKPPAAGPNGRGKKP